MLKSTVSMSVFYVIKINFASMSVNNVIKIKFASIIVKNVIKSTLLQCQFLM
jgi:hypothetical protein